MSEASTCPCEEWITSLPVPGKVICFKCETCGTQYTLFPNGQIGFEEIIGVDIVTGY